MGKHNRKDGQEHPQGGVGRISNIGNNNEEQDKMIRDISHIDQQEGEMNNGETGGNFSGKEEQSREEDAN
jgi:hypothetical protein